MILRPALVLVALSLCVTSFAQRPYYRMVLDTNPQVEKAGAAAMSDFSLSSVSDIRTSFTKDNGSYIGIEGSPDCLNAGVGAQSYTRISNRIVFFGRLSYSYFKGNDMAGSLLMDMYYNPVSFLEPDLSFAGVKTRELYSMAGAMSYALSERFSMGFEMDYESGNNVKVKDPRYRSEWMSLQLAASCWYRANNDFAAGISIAYKDTQEMLKSHIYGSSATTYFFAIDRGGFFGRMESVDVTYGIVSPSTFQPMKNGFIGGSAQVRTRHFYGDFEAFFRDGKYGLDTSSDPVYFKYGGQEFASHGKYLVQTNNAVHDFHAEATLKFLKNSENSVKYSTEAGANTVVTYTGSKDVLDRKDLSANLGYKGSIGVFDNNPSLQFGFDADMQMRIQRTTLYPLYRDHRRTSVVGRAFVDKYIDVKSDLLSFGFSVISGAGFGLKAEDGILASSSGSAFRSFDELLDRQYEYETAPFAGIGFSVSYSRPINSKLEWYVRLSDDIASLLRAPEYLDGRFRNSAVLTIGLNL